MSNTPVARRQRASQIPEITGIRLMPTGGDASLVNISSSGVLVECGSRLAPKMPLTVRFQGTFSPASADGHVARCQVAGIGKDGAIRYHVGIAFTQPIPLDVDAVGQPSAASTEPSPPVPPQGSALPPEVLPIAIPAVVSRPPVAVRNRW